MNNSVQLLSEPTNFAIVQLPNRKYPGIVFQGDSLHILSSQIISMKHMLDQKKLDDLEIELADVSRHLLNVLERYESVCQEKNISLPYVKPL